MTKLFYPIQRGWLNMVISEGQESHFMTLEKE
ncbi:unnamed protein product, partial [marine sediment metagenome]